MRAPRYYDPRDPECPYSDDYTYEDACDDYDSHMEDLADDRRHRED